MLSYLLFLEHGWIKEFEHLFNAIKTAYKNVLNFWKQFEVL